MITKKIIISSLITLCFLNSEAQFFRGIGAFVGVTQTAHKYKNTLDVDSFFFAHTIPAPSHASTEYFSWSAGILAEFLKYDHIRWQTELEYCNKGAVEHPLISPWPISRGGRAVNKLSYIQWNNFVKIFLREGYRGFPYIMLGARIEYNLIRSAGAYGAVIGDLPKFNFSPDAAIGYEFSVYSKFKPFIEYHYNPDVITHHTDPVKFRSRTFELRVGVIWRPKKDFDDCNAPRYYGSDY